MLTLFGTVGGVRAQTPEADGEVLREIGSLDGPEEFTFSWIMDVDVDPSGRFFVLDRDWFGIRWYHPDGRYGGKLGREGQGPGEFIEPTGIDVDAEGRLHVIDPGNGGRVTVYAPRGDGFVYADDHRAETYALDICAAGDRRYLLTSRSDLMIREIAEDGTAVRAFGEPVEPGPYLAREFGSQPTWPLNSGSLLCAKDLPTIVYMSTVMGEVRGYTLDGALLWNVRLTDFYRTDLRRSERLGACCVYRPSPESGTRHQILGGAFGDEEELLVSLWEYGRGGSVDRYETRVLRIRDGAQIGVERDQMIVSDTRGGALVGYSKKPFPRVVVR